jgi:two-component system, NarL family, response regulator DegU
MDEIRVMLVEDHQIFRSGLRRTLELDQQLKVVAEAVDGEEAVTLAEQFQPDIILMDINLPKQNGLQATRQIKAKHPEIGVVVLTAYHDDEQLLHALQAGASAYYPKDVLPDTLLNSIHEVNSGNFVVGEQVLPRAQVAAWMLQQFEEMALVGSDLEDLEMPQQLTDREMQILRHIARGLSNKEIAKTLDISQQTVKNHMTSILRRLAVNDRTQAAVLALKRGWIRLQDT